MSLVTKISINVLAIVVLSQLSLIFACAGVIVGAVFIFPHANTLQEVCIRQKVIEDIFRERGKYAESRLFYWGWAGYESQVL